ncbi:hypothetical protein D9758_016326 [Tetrapyrgos nigripes]|uniref:Secreted protein n=1 Tax=Tetrapyrgos nigripes TaxID=182062 RepID=A0A8H5C4Q0_9AGAR|nr:hypothetical protein D9758_016326 [Tetrapyrgos nigripes]
MCPTSLRVTPSLTPFVLTALVKVEVQAAPVSGVTALASTATFTTTTGTTPTTRGTSTLTSSSPADIEGLGYDPNHAHALARH